MSQEEIVKQAKSLIQELKSKVPGELSMLINTLSIMVETIITLCEKQDEQIANQTKQIESQSKQIESQNASIKTLTAEIKELRRQLGLNSSNSSKPPSTDGYKKKNTSLRGKSGKKRGGQDGHKGAHLSIPHEPDEVKQHVPSKCQGCPNLNNCLASGKVFECAESRYVIKAEISTKVTEHQSLKVTDCPNGNKVKPGEFPSNVKAYVQYDDSIAIFAGLLNTKGAVSLDRTQDLLNCILGINISTGTIYNMVRTCANKVQPIMEMVKACVTKAKVVHFDETGVRVNGKLFWVHNSSTDSHTYQTISQRRGVEGIISNGVLSFFEGIAVHDCWGPYWKFEDIDHAICCVHVLRELNGIIENQPKHTWAKKFKDFLLEMLKTKKEAINSGLDRLDEEILKQYSIEYDNIFQIAEEECPPPQKQKEKKRGRKAKGKERALIERLVKLKDSVCLFIKNFAVPFDNNQAERDVRNVKTKAKVSGCFQSKEGAQFYLTIMSYLSTARKHGINAYNALKAAFEGKGEMVLGLGGSE